MRTAFLSDSAMSDILDRAFRKGKPKAVALVVNSPGGSPAQSSLIGTRIRRLADETEIPVYAFIEDVAASGGYWIAAAADTVYADSCSIVGSIGVVYSGFGFHRLLDKSGIERRIYTAGDEKSMLDAFSPEKPADVARLKDIQGQIHELFIAHVKARRGSRISDEDLYSGRFWLGQRAAELGLVDGIAHLEPKMKELFGARVKFRHYARRRKIFSSIGSQFTDALINDLEERAARARYGC
ncbi:MAG: S49 family peptidase [Rhodobacteraceae bacterium]|nr:S49 family peptidase [Paracoccaceae bacterium]